MTTHKPQYVWVLSERYASLLDGRLARVDETNEFYIRATHVTGPASCSLRFRHSEYIHVPRLIALPLRRLFEFTSRFDRHPYGSMNAANVKERRKEPR